MKRTNCIICKKKTEKPFKEPLIDKQKYPVCSKECFTIYLCCWKEEKEFPENLNNVKDLLTSQQTKPLLEDVKGKDMHPNKMHTSSHRELLKTADTYSKEQIEEFPDY